MIKTNPNLKIGALVSLLFVLFSFSCGNKQAIIIDTPVVANNQFVILSMEMMDAIRAKKSTNNLQMRYEQLNSDSLAKHLVTDDQKKAFWINTYNSFIQIILTEHPEYFENRGDFFGKPRMIIAHKKLSFDDIEHGIIRGSKIKLSLGLINNPFVDEFEKKLRTKNEDGRVHFALNCGAKSCPLISTYDAKDFNSKIDQVAKSFLTKVSAYKKEDNVILTTPLFSWFRGDFDGKNGVLKMLKKYEIIPAESNPKIEYDTYDWTLSLGNYYIQ
jgi:hypothetical protein